MRVVGGLNSSPPKQRQPENEINPFQAALNISTKRVMGIEPTSVAWEANVLPLDDTREVAHYTAHQGLLTINIRRLVRPKN